MTIDSPYTVGIVETRMSTRRPWSVTRMRPSCGQPALGDVHLRHDLDARDDRGLQAPRRRLLVVQDAVDAVADAQRVLERLDVDVRGLGVDGVLDEEVHQADDRRLERHVAQVIDVLVAVGAAVVVHALDDPLQRRRRAVVGAVDRLDDGLGGAHDHLHGEAGRLREVVDDDRIERIGRRDGQDVALDAHRAHDVLAQVLRREILHASAAATAARRA